MWWDWRGRDISSEGQNDPVESGDPRLVGRVYAFISGCFHSGESSPSLGTVTGNINVTEDATCHCLIRVGRQNVVSCSKHAVRAPGVSGYMSNCFSTPVIKSVHYNSPRARRRCIRRCIDLPRSIFNGNRFCVLETANSSVISTKVRSGSLMMVHGRSATSIKSVMITLSKSNRGALGAFTKVSSRSKCTVLRCRGGHGCPKGRVHIQRLIIRNMTGRIVGTLWGKPSVYTRDEHALYDGKMR